MAKTMTILAMDTSGRVGSVAIGRDEEILQKTTMSGNMRHSAEMFVKIEEQLSNLGLKAMDITHVFLTVGPGSFTGLRIGVTLAKMMKLANKSLKILGLSTMDALLENVVEKDWERAVTIVDAKRGQFFGAIYEKEGKKVEKTVQDSMISCEELLEKIGSGEVKLLGEGLVYYKDKFKKENVSFFDEEDWVVNAENVYKLGLKKLGNAEFADPLELKPAYIRGADAVVKKK